LDVFLHQHLPGGRAAIRWSSMQGKRVLTGFQTKDLR